MKAYLDLLAEVLHHGERRTDRTGTGTRGVFGRQLRFDLAQGFPAVTTKKLQFHSVVVELLWFIQGRTDLAFLHQHGVHIWDAWADERGELGPVYGAQWRRWRTADGQEIDQLAQALTQIRETPDSRRILINAWNVGELPAMKLPPCHVLYQFHVGRGRLSCQVYQRSADLFLGLPFNLASYALLTHLLAAQAGLEVGELVHTLGDAHIYENHVEAVKTQLARAPLPGPTLALTPGVARLEDYEPDHIRLMDYQHAPAIKAPIAV